MKLVIHVFSRRTPKNEIHKEKKEEEKSEL